MMKKQEALKLLHEYVKSESLRKHCYSVAAAMESYAKKFIVEGKIDIFKFAHTNENQLISGDIINTDENNLTNNEKNIDMVDEIDSNNILKNENHNNLNKKINMNDEKNNNMIQLTQTEINNSNYVNNENNVNAPMSEEDFLTEIKSENHNFAKEEKELIEKWWVCGLLHDFDWEIHPNLEQHPTEGVKILREKKTDEEICEAILGHGEHTGVKRESLMAKTLFAVDELSGLILALSKVRPNKFEGMNSESVKKAMKKKDFAAAINRQDIKKGIEELGVNEDKHFEFMIKSLAENENHN